MSAKGGGYATGLHAVLDCWWMTTGAQSSVSCWGGYGECIPYRSQHSATWLLVCSDHRNEQVFKKEGGGIAHFKSSYSHVLDEKHMLVGSPNFSFVDVDEAF